MAERSRPWPRHVAVIMDGNGRWAKQQQLPRIEGHRAGIRSVQSVVEACRRLEVSYLTLYTFSVENWKRPKAEVADLMRLLYRYLGEEIPRLHRNHVRLRAIGRLGLLPARVRRRLESIMSRTSDHQSLTLTLALSYGGRAEILDAVAAIAAERRGKEPGPVTVEDIERHLYAPDVPPPDVMIRTSGEMRLSNFLLWESAHARLVFVPELWPDFTGERLEELVGSLRRERDEARRVPA